MKDILKIWQENKSLLQKVLFATLVVHIIYAINSLGFYHPDEQYFAIDYALFKLGHLSASEMSWEYARQIRPWFQPFFHFIYFKICYSLGIDNPFTLMTSLRLIYGVLAAFITFGFSFIAFKEFSDQKQRLWALLFINFSWFGIFFHVRTSSENLSCLLLQLAFVVIYFSRQYLWIIGLLLGLAFNIRPQLGLINLMIGIWFLNKVPWRQWVFTFIIMQTLMIGLGVIADSWGYDEFTISAINYFKVNLIENVVSEFGVHPWYEYIKLIVLKLIPPVSFLYLIGLILILIKPMNFWSFCALLFVLVHHFIGHKELRFLYPAFPMISMLLFTYAFWPKLIKVVFAVNVLVLFIFAFKPAHSPMLFYKRLYQEYIKKPDLKLYALKEEQGNPELLVKFYRHHQFDLKIIKNLSDIPDASFYLFNRTAKKLEYIELQKNCKVLFRTYPAWLLNFNFGNWWQRSSHWFLARCERDLDRSLTFRAPIK